MKKILILTFLISLLNFNVTFGAEVGFSFSHDCQNIEIAIATNGESVLDWGDGNTEALEPSGGANHIYTHTYNNPGIYTVTIKDDVVTTFYSCFKDNGIFEIDVTNSKALEALDCMFNKLTSLDLSGNPLLSYLNCGKNQLTSLDISHNPLLYTLMCDMNQLTSLDISHNPLLTYLSCGKNQLTSLDISHNPLLINLDCEYTQLTSLDISNNLNLVNIFCSNNSDNFTVVLTSAQNAKLEIEGINKKILPHRDIEGTRYKDAVTYLMDNNIISGYPDNTFKPEKTITRAEITTVITKFNALDILDNIPSKFIDIDSHWGKDYINTLANYGFVSGYENNDFRPNNEVTYAEVTAMLLNTLGYKGEIAKMDLGWPNNYITKATNMGLYKNLDASNPNKKMTRGEVAVFVYNAKDIPFNSMVEDNESNLSELTGEGVKIVLTAEGITDNENKIDNIKNMLGERITQIYSKDYEIDVEKYDGKVKFIIIIFDIDDANEISQTLAKKAELKFVESTTAMDEDYNSTVVPADEVVLNDEDIISATDIFAGRESYFIELTLSNEGVYKFADATERMIGKVIFIYLDDEILLAPVVNERIETKNPIITGDYTAKEAKKLAALISLEALPIELIVESAEALDNVNE